MMFRDFHMHTTYCDGSNSAEEMVLAAIEKGMTHIGICTHSHTAFDERYCVKKKDIKAFQAEIAALKEKYKDKIVLLCGVEQDYFGTESTDGFDYALGSVHYVKKGDVYIDVDWNADYLQDELKKHYGGDAMGFAEDYFALVGDVLYVTGADIIGHFDLLTKFNEKTPIFDENHPRYIAAWQKAMDKLLPYNRPFEINTGAISRGYRTTPYPSKAQLEYIYKNGGKIILCSDAHNTDSLCCGYKEAAAMAKEIGFEI